MATTTSDVNTNIVFSADFLAAVKSAIESSDIRCPFRKDLVHFLSHTHEYLPQHEVLLLAIVNNSRIFAHCADKFKELAKAFKDKDDHELCERIMTDHLSRVDTANFAGWVAAAQGIYEDWLTRTVDDYDWDDNGNEEGPSPTSNVAPVGPVPPVEPVPMETELGAPKLIDLFTKEDLYHVALTTKPAAVSIKTWLSLNSQERRLMLTGADRTDIQAQVQ
eukprot:jgi/Botrbrau1/5638/Bobra.55_1s0027.1